MFRPNTVLVLFVSFICCVLAQQYYCVANTGGQVLRMRSSPGTSGSTVTSMPPGAQVRDLGRGLQSANGYTWRNIDYNGMQGWSANEFLTPCGGSPPPPPPPPAQSNYVGCFIDSADRDLGDAFWADGAMTVDRCRSHCSERGYVYAGVQYSTQCFCGNSYGRFGRASDGDCNMACGGDGSSMCGSGWRNSVYRTGTSAPPPPPPPPPAGSKCQQISNIALEKVNCGCPYVWGGTSCGCGGSGGFDCSGIVYYSHHAAGVTNIPRTSGGQMNGSGRSTSCTASNLNNCSPGDLLFYCFPGGDCPNHVNMYVGNGKVVDCPVPGKNCQVLTRISYAANFWGSKSYCN